MINISDKVLFYVKEVQEAISKGTVMPVTCEIDPTTLCQNKCYFCVNKESNKNSGKILDIGVYDNLLKDLKEIGVRSISYTGGGEPLLHPQFNYMAAKAFDCGFKIGLITNGIKLDKLEHADLFEFIRVSLYGVDQESYIESTGTDYFNQVVENIKKILGTKGVTIGLSFIAKNEEISEKADRLAERLGVDYIQFKPLLDDSRNFNLPEYVGKKTVLTNRCNVHSDLPCKIAGLIGIVSADANVYYCCMKRGNSNFCLGNLRDRSFRELWERRKDMDPRGCTDVCRYSGYAQSYEKMTQQESHFIKHRDFL